VTESHPLVNPGWVADRGLITVLAIVTMLVGFLFGRAYQAVSRAYTDWQKTKEAVPVMRKLFYGLIRSAVVLGLIAAVVVVGMSTWMVNGDDTKPTGSVTSPSPAPPR
jgi:hypothetical protein